MNASHGDESIVDTISGVANAKGTPSAKEVLKNGTFMLLFAAQLTQNIGAAVSWLALQFFIFKLTNSPGKMGILSIVFFLPYVLFTPFAGVLVDRFDQRKIMLYSNMLSFLASVGYIIVYVLRESFVVIINVNGLNMASVRYILLLLYILTFINSSAASIFFPARSAYTRLIVKKKNLLIANSIGSTVFQVATIIGYVLAGVIANRSYLGSFIFDAATFAFSMTMMFFIILVGKKPPEVKRPEEATFRAQAKGVYDDLVIGFKTIRGAPKISYMLIVFAFTIFSFSTFNVLFIVILQGEMGLTESWYGILQAVMGVSGIIMSLTLMGIGKIKRKIAMLNIALIGATLFLYFFAFARTALSIGILLFIFGVVLSTINVSAPTLIQEQIPYEKQGRVFGTQQLFQGIARLVGMGIVSLVAEVVLPKYIILVAAGILTIVMIWGMIYSNRGEVAKPDYIDDVKEPEFSIGKAEEIWDTTQPNTAKYD